MADMTENDSSLSGESPGQERRRLLVDESESIQKGPTSKIASASAIRLRKIEESPSSERTPPSTPSGNDDDPKRKECGFVCIFRTLLNLLPAFGDDDDNTERSEELLKFGALQIINLLVPVTICMAVVLTFVLSVALKADPNALSAGLNILSATGESGSSDSGQQILQAIISVAIIITIVIAMTILLVCLFKFKCYKVIYGWLLVASILLLFVFASLYILDICSAHNLPLDWFSLSFCIWNFGIMGIIVIHWKGPLRLQQAYLIIVCSLVATRLLLFLPEWTTWLLLFAISVWDIIAVLCPKGPLRILVETAQERNVDLFPALIYSSTMMWTIGMADVPKKKGTTPSVDHDNEDEGGEGDPPTLGVNESNPITHDTGESEPPVLNINQDTPTDTPTDTATDTDEQNTSEQGHRSSTPGEPARQRTRPQQNTEDNQEEETERRGVRLGLGDFIFYSLLIGKAANDSKGDWVIISSCFVSILIGLCMTTILLGMLRRALPALPISIIFGLIFYFTSRYLLSPFAVILAVNQVFL